MQQPEIMDRFIYQPLNPNPALNLGLKNGDITLQRIPDPSSEAKGLARYLAKDRSGEREITLAIPDQVIIDKGKTLLKYAEKKEGKGKGGRYRDTRTGKDYFF